MSTATPQQRHVRLAIKHGNEVIKDFKSSTLPVS